MSDETALTVALIGLVGIILVALVGLGGALLGSAIGARATRQAAALAQEEARADRAEARRSRFADRVVDLAVEVLEAADDDAVAVMLQWRLRRAGSTEPLPRRPRGATMNRVVMRLRMLVVEPSMLTAIEDLEDAVGAMLESAIDTDRPYGVIAPPATDEDGAAWDELADRYTRASVTFERTMRTEIGASIE